MDTPRKSFLVLLTLAATALLILTIRGPSTPRTKSHFTPSLPLTPKFHADNSSFTDWSHHSDPIWDTVLPPNKGYALATNLTTGFHYWGNIAMFHQLQCLLDIRKQLIVFSEHWDEAVNFVAEKGEGSRYEWMGHCFEYLRQGILCHADPTLNPVANAKAGGQDVQIMDGNALWHTCRDSGPLFDWALASGVPRRDRLLFIDQNQ